MARLKSQEVEKEAVRMVAALMASSARTAPKARGVDVMETMVLDGDDLATLAGAIDDKAREKSPALAAAYKMDARNVRNSSCVLLIGIGGEPPKIEDPLDCGACGYRTCRQLMNARKRKGNELGGPICIFQAINLGIALGSAVKMASDLNVDNRMMYTIGDGAQKLGILDSDFALGIPLSVTGKSFYFDRK